VLLNGAERVLDDLTATTKNLAPSFEAFGFAIDTSSFSRTGEHPNAFLQAVKLLAVKLLPMLTRSFFLICISEQ